jgi:hypothetical protein
MTNETIGSKGPDLDQRRRYPAPTIDLTATEIAASTSPRLHPKSGSPDFGPSSSLSKSETSDFDREVDAQIASGEGGVPESPPLREAPHPDPLTRSPMFPTSANVDSPNSGEPDSGAGGERERTESAGGNDPPNGPPWRDWTFAQWSRAASAPFWRLVGAGAAGAAIMLLVVLGLWAIGFLSHGDDSVGALSNRLVRIETQLDTMSARGTRSGDPALANRMAATESALKALVADTAGLNSRLSEVANTARDARAEAAKAATSERQGPSRAAQSDLDALSARIAALETATATVEKQLGKAVSPAGDQAARLAVLATSLRLAVERGNGFAAELDDMKSVSKDPHELAPLEPFAASGVPTPAILVRDLSTLVPALMQAGSAPPSEGSYLSRLEANAQRLVRIRPVDETPGDEPATVISRIELRSARGDIPGALAEFAKLPPQARAPAEAWIRKAESREAAIALARKISADALGALTVR